MIWKRKSGDGYIEKQPVFTYEKCPCKNCGCTCGKRNEVTTHIEIEHIPGRRPARTQYRRAPPNDQNRHGQDGRDRRWSFISSHGHNLVF